MNSSLWSSPELLARSAEGIARHRQSDATLQAVAANGAPAAGVPVKIEQVTSDFLFGANAFMLGCYGTPLLNARYESAFCGLFNAATAPLYWRDLEPEPGHLRFAADSIPIRRRPPPDTVVAFANQHGLNLNGHPLVWNYRKWSAPDWIRDGEDNASRWEERIRQIAERYGHSIPRWDVVNEVVANYRPPIGALMPPDYARLAFRWAEKYLPETAFLMINETTGAFAHDREPYAALIQRLLDDGARIDGIGLQFHLFQNEDVRRMLRGERFRPEDLQLALDTFATFGRPLHISEITLPSLENDAAGRQAQAELATALYRLWFSHPAVHAITWWNLPDGAAAPGEDGVPSGLLNADLTPKPAYLALHDLIHIQWRTRLTTKADADGQVAFRGFHGWYKITVGEGTPEVVHITPASTAHTVTAGARCDHG
jgi:GH35 family endo-1,4-beta-xylanase